MNRFLAALVVLGLSCVALYAQAGKKTRPRVVKTPTKTPVTEPGTGSKPPVLKNETPNAKSGRRPPVLTDTTGKQPSTQTNQSVEPEVAEEDDEIIKIETNYVTLPVTVLDRNGRFVAGVNKREFKIYENGVEQRIEFFESVEKPFTVVLMLDVSPSTQYKIDEIRSAAISFVNQLRNNDKVMVVSFDEKYRILSRPTSNRSQLRYAINQARFGGGTSLYDAVSKTITRELRQVKGRKAVVLFTDGVDTTSRRANYHTTIRQVEEVDALIYPIHYNTYNGYARGGGRNIPRRVPRSSGNILIDILGGIMTGGNVRVGSGGAGTSAEEYRKGKEYLNELASYSGGRFFSADTTYNLDAAFRSIAEELRKQYSIGYYPEVAGEEGERKRIRVRVSRPNLVVRTKNTYIVGKGT
ncbi:MAG: VWA domain-containing protein [Pyrinomonadaceae bacterium]|nr:VWA domain-containing protein [Pyrinomonadaceae bacterium]